MSFSLELIEIFAFDLIDIGCGMGAIFPVCNYPCQLRYGGYCAKKNLATKILACTVKRSMALIEVCGGIKTLLVDFNMQSYLTV